MQPVIYYGTYRIDVSITEKLVHYAIKLGMHIDTAQLYKNDHIVANVVRQYRHMGKPVTYTTKIKRNLIKNCIKDNRGIYNSVYEIINDPLTRPNLILLHSPEPNFSIAWEQLTSIQVPGVSYGVSNFTVDDMKQLSSTPEVNQIEVTPFNNCVDTVKYCKLNGITVQAHSSLTKGELLDSDVLCQAAKSAGITPAQAMIVWSRNLGYVPIFSSTSLCNISEIMNCPNIPDFTLPESMHCNYKTHPQYYV